ncbi:sun domain-containing protein 1, partial [Plakobranchus ocellatus]
EDFTSSDQGSETSSVRGRRSRGRNIIYTSTPHQSHHISTHDHYYDGMLLRSGHKVEGVKWHMDKDGMVYQYDASGTSLLPTPIGHRSELDMSKIRSALTSNSTVTTKLMTTTTTTTTNTTTSGESQRRTRGRKSIKETEDEMEERKLRLDESETEKHGKRRDQYVIEHLYGLDSDGEFSDVDEVDFNRYATSTLQSTQNYQAEATRRSFFTYLYTIITTVITTITTTITEGSIASGIKSIAATASKPILVLTHWLMRHVAQFFSWLITKSARILLFEIELKQRRHRAGCCCFWLFPLLLLLPLLLLAAYYWQSLFEASHLAEVGQATGHLGTHLYTGVHDAMSATQGAVASGWSNFWLWLTALSLASSKGQDNIPSPPKPVAIPAAESASGVDLDQLYLYIQQTVDQSWQIQGNELRQQIQQIQIPGGMTKEEVEAIIAEALMNEKANINGGMIGLSTDIKSLLETRSSALEAKMAELEREIKHSGQEQQSLISNFEQTKASFESLSADEKAKWAAVAAALEAKLADMSAAVNQLSSQNAALTALVGNCCRNNSLLADTVKAHVLSILAEMSTDESSPLSGMVNMMGSQYVEKSELDRRLKTASADVLERVMAILATKLEEERKEREKQIADKEKDMAAELHLSAGHIGSIDESMVKSIVDEALAQFSADRVGLPDFALESAGGSVLSVRCSETYYRKTALVSVFGLPLWYTSNSPRTVIQPNVHPGECWAFKGQSGYIVLQLSHPIQVTGFTLEHIPRTLAPRGDISSAPYKFSVFGLVSETDTIGVNLGNYTYEDNGTPIQHYDIQSRHPGIFQLVELRVQTNHGNPEYTCIYRFRVHGLP